MVLSNVAPGHAGCIYPTQSPSRIARAAVLLTRAAAFLCPFNRDQVSPPHSLPQVPYLTAALILQLWANFP